MQNPWLNIPASDYEGHMSAPHVGQHYFLNNLFKKVLRHYKPYSVLVAGSTTGNGFEHFDFRFTKNVVGVELNEEYIKIARERYKDERIKFINEDICTVKFSDQKFELVHAALIFEYVDYKTCLDNLLKCLKPGGIISVVLQLSSESQSKVSKTEFKSLESLNPVIKLIDPGEFINTANELSLIKIKDETITLESGKSFYFGVFR